MEMLKLWKREKMLMILNTQAYLWNSVKVMSWLGLAWFLLGQAHYSSLLWCQHMIAAVKWTQMSTKTFCLLMKRNMHQNGLRDHYDAWWPYPRPKNPTNKTIKENLKHFCLAKSISTQRMYHSITSLIHCSLFKSVSNVFCSPKNAVFCCAYCNPQSYVSVVEIKQKQKKAVVSFIASDQFSV